MDYHKDTKRVSIGLEGSFQNSAATGLLRQSQLSLLPELRLEGDYGHSYATR